MFLVGFLIWIVAEIAAVIAVAHVIGVLWCVLALVAGWPIGGWLLRAEGRATLVRLRDGLAAGRAPGPELADGALALLAGPMLIVPGFITDAIGLALLVPAVRHRLRDLLIAHARGRFVSRAASFTRGARRDYDVDSTAYDTPPTRSGDRPQLHG